MVKHTREAHAAVVLAGEIAAFDMQEKTPWKGQTRSGRAWNALPDALHARSASGASTERRASIAQEIPYEERTRGRKKCNRCDGRS